LNEELRRKGSALKSVQNETMVARDTKQDAVWKKKYAGGKGTIICRYCNKKGHTRNKCYAYRRDQKKTARGGGDSDAQVGFARVTDSDTSCDVILSEKP